MKWKIYKWLVLLSLIVVILYNENSFENEQDILGKGKHNYYIEKERHKDKELHTSHLQFSIIIINNSNFCEPLENNGVWQT